MTVKDSVAFLFGELVCLTPPRLEEAALYLEWLNDPALDRLSGSEPFAPCTMEQVEGYIRSWQGADSAEKRWTIVELPGDRPIGQACIWDIDRAGGSASVGLEIARPQDRGQGRGAEALRLLCGHAFGQMGLRVLWAQVNPDNSASMRLFERVGFRPAAAEGGRHRLYRLESCQFVSLPN